MQLNPLYNHQEQQEQHEQQDRVVITIVQQEYIIPTVSTKWSCILFCALVCVDIIVVLVAYLITGSFQNWIGYVMAGTAICILLMLLFCLIDCIVLSCRRKN
jgi:hypothetical protein